MTPSGSTGSWSLMNTSVASSKSQVSIKSPKIVHHEPKTVKFLVGPKPRILTINEDLFHQHIPGFRNAFAQFDFHGQEKNIILTDKDGKDVEVVIKWIQGRKDIYADERLYEGLGYKIHNMTCFKIFRLAAEMGIEELKQECLFHLENCLRGGKWPVTVETVAAAYRSEDPRMEALRGLVVFGAIEEFFLGGRVGDSSLWKKAVKVDKEFEKQVFVGIGYHMTRKEADCLLEKCYVHPKRAHWI